MKETKVAATAKRRPTRGHSPEGLGHNAHQQIRDLIVAMKLSPGAPLSESELTMKLGASRTPIRQALQQLEQEGFVVAHRHGAVTRLSVAPMTVEDMKELHAIFGALQGLAARSATQLPEAARLDLASRLEGFNNALRAAWQSRPGRVREAQDLHVAFHRAIDEAVTGRRLAAELRALQPQVERYERVYTSAVLTDFSDALKEHEDMIEAIRKGDADAAERATTENWRRGSERYERVVQDLGERGAW
jgi:DNA-binding GntR family transcriptional regulator